jgi:hypothetical protein
MTGGMLLSPQWIRVGDSHTGEAKDKTNEVNLFSVENRDDKHGDKVVGVARAVAGVLLAFTIPARTYVDRRSFLERSRILLDRFEASAEESPEAHSALRLIETESELVESPLHRMEHSLHPWVSFAIMPLFAFANSGAQILGKCCRRSAPSHRSRCGVRPVHRKTSGDLALCTSGHKIPRRNSAPGTVVGNRS